MTLVKKLYRCQMHNSTTDHLYSVLCVHLPKSKLLLSTFIPSYPPPLLSKLTPAVHAHEFSFLFLFFSIPPTPQPSPSMPAPPQLPACPLKESLLVNFCKYAHISTSKCSVLLSLMHFTHFPLLKHTWIISTFALLWCISKIFSFLH